MQQRQRQPGATTIYRAEENGTISLRQGGEWLPEYVRYPDGTPVRQARRVETLPDGGVCFIHAGDRPPYEIGWDDIARPLDAAEYERRRSAEVVRFCGPLSDWV